MRAWTVLVCCGLGLCLAGYLVLLEVGWVEVLMRGALKMFDSFIITIKLL